MKQKIAHALLKVIVSIPKGFYDFSKRIFGMKD